MGAPTRSRRPASARSRDRSEGLPQYPCGRQIPGLGRHCLVAVIEPEPLGACVADADALFEELDRIRELGVAFNDEGSTEGFRSVGVPVTGPEGDVLGAFAVAGPTHRMRGETFETELPDLTRSVVNELELNLAYS